MSANTLNLTRDRVQSTSDLLLKVGKALRRASARDGNAEWAALAESAAKAGWEFDAAVDALAEAVPA